MSPATSVLHHHQLTQLTQMIIQLARTVVEAAAAASQHFHHLYHDLQRKIHRSTKTSLEQSQVIWNPATCISTGVFAKNGMSSSRNGASGEDP
jgi:hypothetical protein